MKKGNIKNLLILSSLMLCFTAFAQTPQVKVYAVKLDEGEANPLIEVKQENVEDKIGWKNLIYLQPEVTFQTIEGIGGAFNEIGGEALLSLSEEKQQEVMENMFSGDKAGFTFCRTAIGASDFGIDAYSYSEVAGDYKMKQFSIERDKKYVLPYIKSAFAINPNLTLFGSPWSPPGWMKESGYMVGLKEPNNNLKQDPKTLQAYAKYFVKYVEAYEKEGVKVDRICIQNENDANTKYPSCTFPAKDMVNFANTYLIPAFEKNKIEAGIYAGTFRAAEKMDLMDFMTADGKENLEGVGMQYTDTRFLGDARAMMPNLKFFHTEGHCYNGKNSVEQAEDRLEEIAGYINAGSTTFTYWNMILNETTESGWNWTQNSLINIDRKSGEIIYNPDYNAMYIISKFVKPGDVRIACVQRGKEPLIAVKSPDGQIKVLFQNTNANEKSFEVVMGDQNIKVKAPGKSIIAIVL
ncbi:glycoside hydrolase family 30 protein [Labilibacter marinus]|uniref:glycoside hydrolase family 30 protein n=1 Tax=Labilibacter marinus TaxID=1477105 RepID=UPI00094FA7EE|nr:glycoside hydrolase family 30 beta sandwich domain-containing protein [Labilibacter marinus]